MKAHSKRIDSEARRRQLLRVSMDLFSKHGFSGTKTRDIAAAAEVSEAILFRHFSSKEDLYQAILATQEHEGAQQWFEEMRAFADRRDDAGFFRCLILQIFKSFKTEPTFHRMMMYASLEGHVLADLFHDRWGSKTFRFLRAYIARRQKEGAFRAGDPSADVFFVVAAPVLAATNKYLHGVKLISIRDERLADQFTDLVLHGLRKRP
jgi:TetR/AcrR family transcriptional regulator